MRFSLLYRGNFIELSSPVTLIGRSVGCKVMLEGAAVSRRHARLRIVDEQLSVEDLDSHNGVFLNGRRIERERCLEHGDRLLVGGHELRVVTRASRPASERPVADGEADATRISIDSLWDDDEDEAIDAFASVTKRSDPLALMSGAVAEALAAGQVAQAESAFDAFADTLSGRVADRGPEWRRLAERGCDLAMRLAAATGRARWLDLGLELAGAAGKRLDGERLAQLDLALRSVGAPSRESLQCYIGLLEADSHALTEVDQRLLRRLRARARVALPARRRRG